MTQSELWNLADCATRRGIRAMLDGDKNRANGEFDTAESYQRRHSYTLADYPGPYALERAESDLWLKRLKEVNSPCK